MEIVRSEFPGLVGVFENLITSGVADKMIKNADVKTAEGYGKGQQSRNRELKLNAQKGFKEVELYLLKKHALKLIRPFMVVQAVIFDKACDGVVMLIKKVFQRESTEVFLENLDKLKIYATCQSSELEEGCADPTVGDVVKAAILKVDQHTDEVFVSMRNDRKRVHLLGVTGAQPKDTWRNSKPRGLTQNQSSGDAFDPANEITDGANTPSAYAGFGVSPAYTQNSSYSPAYNPSPYYANATGGTTADASFYAPSPSYNNQPSANVLEQRHKAWLEKVNQHPLYRNPHGHNLMIHAFNIKQYVSCLHHGAVLGGYDPKNNHKTLRANQNKAFARKSLEKGVAFAKQGQTESAVKCYDHALEIDPQFTDALVAKGALLAKGPEKNYDEAISLLERALKIDPLTENALEYLQKVLAWQEGETEMPGSDTEELLQKCTTKQLKTLRRTLEKKGGGGKRKRT